MKPHTLLVGSALAAVAVIPNLANAQPDAHSLSPGTYRCASYNVSGGGGSCRNLPRLVLNADGTYQYSSTRGQWSVQKGKLVLSESRLWGPGELLGRDTVRFRYDYRGWQHVVTWVCQECAGQAAEAAGRALLGGSPAAGGAPVGVSLTLEFDRHVGGVSGFVIVPAEQAPTYTHHAPLPRGAVQGLAWETSATTVALATNTANKLPSGKRYVVFLSWPRETLPVAILDLPPTNTDYTARLRATLEGASVWRQLGNTPSTIPAEPRGSEPVSSSPSGSAGEPAKGVEELSAALRVLSQAIKPGREATPGNRGSGSAPPHGVELTDVTPEIARAVGNPALQGAGVVRVQADSPAARAGIQDGDIITAINGTRITSAAQAATALGQRAPGRATRIQVFRTGRYTNKRLLE